MRQDIFYQFTNFIILTFNLVFRLFLQLYDTNGHLHRVQRPRKHRFTWLSWRNSTKNNLNIFECLIQVSNAVELTCAVRCWLGSHYTRYTQYTLYLMHGCLVASSIEYDTLRMRSRDLVCSLTAATCPYMGYRRSRDRVAVTCHQVWKPDKNVVRFRTP